MDIVINTNKTSYFNTWIVFDDLDLLIDGNTVHVNGEVSIPLSDDEPFVISNTTICDDEGKDIAPFDCVTQDSDCSLLSAHVSLLTAEEPKVGLSLEEAKEAFSFEIESITIVGKDFEKDVNCNRVELVPEMEM